MKALLIDTHLLVPRSRSSTKVKVKYQGHVSKKMGVSGALVFHKHILFKTSLIKNYLNSQRMSDAFYHTTESSELKKRNKIIIVINIFIWLCFGIFA